MNARRADRNSILLEKDGIQYIYDGLKFTARVDRKLSLFGENKEEG